ncbi:beta-N-acetylhexosaminidase [Streptomyces argyrophyllae]|uniref:beta-N-acetylhexosaminidase n=1 Tax=Streptomyces argyrophylli TaxID=2726118 RepID=A0A6M4PTP3_9ACTN|nr:beta-N-acetylhexosaminidase [Streptomyces argyrophyllae]QJS13999.1 beta-N-acetylhexosaminidase [Streptomyces argyrophyllae]
MSSPRREQTLLPRPARYAPRSGHFTLDAATTVRATPEARGAADLLRTLLGPTTGLPLAPSADGAVTLAVDAGLHGLGEEGYGLTVSPHSVLLRAATPTGLLRGVQTLRQLLPPEALARATPRPERWELPCTEITDLPRHEWRGLMIDVARHFHDIATLRRQVDLLALHKLNVLHLHLTDDQGWRMPVPAYPRLTSVGGHRAESMIGPDGSTRFDGRPHGGAYTRAELTGLVAYAARRGVTVMPEIGMPGHVRAALAAYPHLGNRPDRALDVWTRWGVCDTILGVHDEVLDFYRAVLAEVMDVFPSPYVHLGGDECPTTEWERSPAARARAAAEGLPTPAALHGWLLGRAATYLLERGRRPVGWAENGTRLPPGFTVMSWREPGHAAAALRRGHDVVLTHHRTTYLDYAQDAASGGPFVQPGPVVDLRAVHSGDPQPRTGTSGGRVLGTQAQIWTEFVPTAAHLDRLAYPRLCALADRAWSGPTSWPDFTDRLGAHTPRLDALGVRRHPTPLAPRTDAAPAGTAPSA